VSETEEQIVDLPQMSAAEKQLRKEILDQHRYLNRLEMTAWADCQKKIDILVRELVPTAV